MPDLLSSDRLIVNQKAKLIEVTNQYLIRDAQGEELGYMQQEGKSNFACLRLRRRSPWIRR
jgi:hypothetical protein